MNTIKSIHIHQLLRLRDIKVDFQEKGVTAIMGANGTGKTTLLQALACIYRNDTRISISQEQYRYTDFFKEYEGNDWQGSQFNVSFTDDKSISYQKSSTGWRPMTQHKKPRYSKYINILECVPDQEKERETKIEDISTSALDISDQKKNTLISKASATLNRGYSDTCFVSKAKGLKNFTQATVHDKSLGEISYLSHFMGAGEQKTLHILHEVLRAPREALILIEELEISLHDSAIKSLINFLLEQSNQKNLQIVFTTHWLGINEFEENDSMNIVSLYIDPDTDIVTKRDGFDPQFIHNLSGDYEQMRQIKVWVEDGLASEIVRLVARSIGIMPFLEIRTFGSIQNAYTIAGAVAVMEENLDTTLIVTDGDRYTSEQEKKRQISHAIDGNGVEANNWRIKALQLIADLNSPQQNQPEKVILEICQGLSDNAPTWVQEDLRWINQQHPVPQGKEAIKDLAEHKNIQEQRIITQYLDVASETECWNTYIAPLKERLIQIAENLGIDLRLTEVVA